MSHNFKLTTFKVPTYCYSCKKFLWGIYHNGHECTDCGFPIHYHCISNEKSKCTGKKGGWKPQPEKPPTSGSLRMSQSKKNENSNSSGLSLHRLISRKVPAENVSPDQTSSPNQPSSPQSLQSNPSTQPIQSNPSTQPIQSNPSTQPTQSNPSTQPIQSNPSTQPIQSNPSTQPIQSNPSTQPLQSNPSPTSNNNNTNQNKKPSGFGQIIEAMFKPKKKAEELKLDFVDIPDIPDISESTIFDGFKLVCFSPEIIGRSELESGNKVLLPSSILETFTRNDTLLPYPLIFEICNANFESRKSYVGVLEFTADEGTAIVPQWILSTLLTDSGEQILLKQVSLPKGTSVKLQPLKSEFAERCNNPKGILETHLSQNYVSLAQNETILIAHEDQRYEFEVLECSPESAILIIDTDLNVDFEPAKDSESQKPVIQIEIDKPIEATVEANGYTYLVFEPQLKDEKSGFVFEIEPTEGDPDLYIDQDIKKPDQLNYTWCANLVGGERIIIPSWDHSRNSNKRYYIGIRGHKVKASFKFAVFIEEESDSEEETEKTSKKQESGHILLRKSLLQSTEVAPEDDMERCSNCHQWVPAINITRHEAFCQRNNYRCQVCKRVVRTTDKENHQHCSHCSLLTTPQTLHEYCEKCQKCMPQKEYTKHNEVYHTDFTCECGQVFELEAMLGHKKTTCDRRQTACKWCQTPFQLRHIHQHQEECGSHTRSCEICGAFMPLKKMENHYAAFHNQIYNHDKIAKGSSGVEPSGPSQVMFSEPATSSTSTNFLASSAFICPGCAYRATGFDDLQSHLNQSYSCLALFQ